MALELKKKKCFSLFENFRGVVNAPPWMAPPGTHDEKINDLIKSE